MKVGIPLQRGDHDLKPMKINTILPRTPDPPPQYEMTDFHTFKRKYFFKPQWITSRLWEDPMCVQAFRVDLYVCVHTVEATAQCQVTSSSLFSLFSISHCLWTELIISASWLVSESPLSTCLHLPRAGVTGACHHAQLFHGFWGFKLMFLWLSTKQFARGASSPVLTPVSF